MTTRAEVCVIEQGFLWAICRMAHLRTGAA
jgi:hypothetical protein